MAIDASDLNADLHASAAYRANLISVQTQRAVAKMTSPERLRRFPFSRMAVPFGKRHRRCCGAALARRLLAQGAPVSKGACTNGDVFE